MTREEEIKEAYKDDILPKQFRNSEELKLCKNEDRCIKT